MWAFRRCIPETFNIIAPEAPVPDPVGGFSWWDINSTDSVSGGENAAHRLADFIVRAEEFYDLAPSIRIGCGFSQGAGTLSVALQRGAYFRGVALLAGFVVERGEFTGDPTTSVFIAHGTEDEMVSVERARRGRDFLSSRDFIPQYVEDPVGHKVGTGGMRALSGWFAGFIGK
jgi:phospholipase/carboxylesterase